MFKDSSLDSVVRMISDRSLHPDQILVDDSKDILHENIRVES